MQIQVAEMESRFSKNKYVPAKKSVELSNFITSDIFDNKFAV